jgi:hypothetical protein
MVFSLSGSSSFGATAADIQANYQNREPVNRHVRPFFNRRFSARKNSKNPRFNFPPETAE